MASSNIHVGAAVAVPLSDNSKIGRVATTYTGTQSCPATCALRGNGCYYETGIFTRALNNRLNTRSTGRTSLDIARDEARAIDRMLTSGAKGRALRLHTGGDCRTNGAAKAVSAAVRRWTKRGGGPAWTYTHAWRTVERLSWTGVSVLGSIESTKQGAEVLSRWYAPAVVVDAFPAGKKSFERDGVTWIPCPAQTHDDIACVDCKLCWRGDSLAARNAGVAFAAHGSSRGMVKRRLAVLNNVVEDSVMKRVVLPRGKAWQFMARDKKRALLRLVIEPALSGDCASCCLDDATDREFVLASVVEAVLGDP